MVCEYTFPHLLILFNRYCGGPPLIYLDKKAEMKYLKLEHLGEVLKDLSTELLGMFLYQII